MSKVFVKKTPDGDKVPFLRGILTQSLVKSGITFEDAYLIAQEVKDSLADDAEITTAELRILVGKLITSRFGKEKRTVYDNKDRLITDITVVSPSGHDYFSTDLLTHSLEACAISSNIAVGAARCVYEKLLVSGAREVDCDVLQNIIHNCLSSGYSEESANRYLAWKQFKKSGRPLIILLWGVTGAGKSTISSELSYRLNITGIQSTDLMREIIRSYLTPSVVPTLGYSSFEAWRGLRMTKDDNSVKHETKLIMGFLSQMETMLPALEATLKRALKEDHSLILEGVHIMPSRLHLGPLQSGALIVPFIVATMSKEVLQKRFSKRGSEHTARKASRYIEHFEDIWELQSFLLGEADDAGVSIINSGNMEEAIKEILEVISKIVVRQYLATTNAQSSQTEH
jgi:2-phosphoglycerate kinase